MVQIMIIIPYEDASDYITGRIKDLRDNDIVIHTSHVYGNAGTPDVFREMDIIVARGITCASLRKQYPQKHIIEINMTSFDILDAISAGIDMYDPKKVAVCMHLSHLIESGALEKLSGVEIHKVSVVSDEDVESALEIGCRSGVDTYIGGLTLKRRCNSLGFKCVHIKTSKMSLEQAINDAIGTARAINQERIKLNVMQSVLNNAQGAMFAVDTDGRITVFNNQACALLKIPVTENVIGKSVDLYCKNIDWANVVKNGVESEYPQNIFGALYYVRCRPVFVDKQCAGALVSMLEAAEIQAVETKIRKELSAKGLTAKYSFDDIVGVSKEINDCIAIAKKYSQVDANVLLIGETGTGKELFAHSIHKASKRSNQPFVAVNCAALPEALLESELFGYVEGAFSGAVKGGKLGLFEIAHKGTIFLDEIGELPITLQAKLLRALQEREIRRIGDDRVHPVDVRVISATNVDIKTQIAEKKFRADLYYRLNLLNLTLVPLCRRSEDIVAMADFFLKHFAIMYGKAAPLISKDAIRIIKQYPWPGNSRELRNFCEKLVVLSDEDVIDGAQLTRLGLEGADIAAPHIPDDLPLDKDKLYELLARPHVKKDELAKMLGVSRSTLWRWSKGK